MLKNLDILQIVKGFSSFPISYQAETLNIFLNEIINKAYITTHFLNLLPFNKIRQDKVDIIVDKLITYYDHAFFEDSVYFCNNSSLKSTILFHPRILSRLAARLKQNLEKTKKFKPDFAKYIGLARILQEKNVTIKDSSNNEQTMNKLASKIYF